MKMQVTKFRTLYLPLSALVPHPVVQRLFDQAHSDNIAANFDPDVFGELYATPGPDGTYYVWDGQHRADAAAKVLGRAQQVPCRVYESVPHERLARIQYLINRGRKGWRALDMFKQSVLAKDERALDIKKIVESNGLHLHDQKTENSVSAIGAVEAIYKSCGRDGLNRVLSIIHEAWGGTPDAYHTNLLRGTGLLVHRYNGELRDKELSLKLRKEGTPADLIGRARSKHKNDGISPIAAVAALMVNIYNKKRTANRLETWQ